MVHDLSEAVAILVLAVKALKEHVTDDEGKAILSDLEIAADRCPELFDQLRKVI